MDVFPNELLDIGMYNFVALCKNYAEDLFDKSFLKDKDCVRREKVLVCILNNFKTLGHTLFPLSSMKDKFYMCHSLAIESTEEVILISQQFFFIKLIKHLMEKLLSVDNIILKEYIVEIF